MLGTTQMCVICVRLMRLVDANAAPCIRLKDPEPTQSLAILDAAILRPAYCKKRNQRFAFYDLVQIKKCQAGGTITPGSAPRESGGEA